MDMYSSSSSFSCKPMRGAQLHIFTFFYCKYSSPIYPSFDSVTFFPPLQIQRRKCAARQAKPLHFSINSVITHEDVDFHSGFSGRGTNPTDSETKVVKLHEDSRTKFNGRLRLRLRRADGLELGNKKSECNSSGDILKGGLDLCSKKGDFMGALKLYDLAKNEGIKMNQYHFAVLLYLCSSAATGIVKPAKSGNKRLKPVEKIEYFDVFPVEENGIYPQTLDEFVQDMKKNGKGEKRVEIQVNEDMKRIAIDKGLEIYNEMLMKKIPMNEAIYTSAARMAMALDDGDLAFEIVKKMKACGIVPRLRSYIPALSIFCSNRDIVNAFKVENHMTKHNVQLEEPQLRALLKVSIETRDSDKVYYILHKLRERVRKVTQATLEVIESWFCSEFGSRIGKKKWDSKVINEASSNGGGGWHGKGWLGKGKWIVCQSFISSSGLCNACGEKLVNIDLDPIETEKFADSVAAIASKREKNSSFEKFQKWLDYYGPFEAVVDAANVGLNNNRKFRPSKVNATVNGIRQMLPSRKWPLIVVHNRRISGGKMEHQPFNKSLIEKWKNADAIYATPTGSNDDWYWLYAAIKMRSLIVTNDEMRDHLFQLLGDDFFPKWKERHQVHFSFDETGPVFHMPPPYSVVIQESNQGHWHIPIASEVEREDQRKWLCCTRSIVTNGKKLIESRLFSSTTESIKDQGNSSVQNKKKVKESNMNVIRSLMIPRNSRKFEGKYSSILPQIQAAEEFGAYTLDFQI